MSVLSRDISQVVAYFKRTAPSQAGIISGANPTTYNINDPFPLWVIQVFIIICFTQLLGLALAKFRQPRVIAEVIGGVILGPTVMGRIPGFTNAIFPNESLAMLALTSTIGLVLFLFLVGLEIDVRVLRRNARYSLGISAVGMILPFSLGVGLAVALYHKFVNPDVNFGHFLLFVGVAVSITALPILCRILSDLKILDQHVGAIVLSAGVANDVVGWVLLALSVALANASSGLAALWILLTGAGFVIFLLYPGRWAFVWLARRTGSLENGSPSPLMMTVTLLVILGSAFFTDVIGVHPIFGGFIAGLIIPHEGGFAIALVEKLEDLVCIIFLPLYFALSGLNTNLGLLNTGISWAYIVLICVIAFLGKFIGCALTAKLMGFSYRESGAIGTLMSCKGLVELIVLNVGLQANILDTRLFSMFVVHALILTVMTTPLTMWLYPSQHRTGRNPREVKDAENAKINPQDHSFDDVFKDKFSVVLNKIEHLPAIMTITQLLQSMSKASSVISRGTVESKKDLKGDSSRDITQEIPELSPTHQLSNLVHLPVKIDALRLMELTDRTSTVMRSSADDLIQRDPLVSVFTAFGRLLNIAISSTVSIVYRDALATTVAAHVEDKGSQMVIVPWQVANLNSLPDYDPFDGMFGKAGVPERVTSVVYENFVRKVFAESPADVALFIDRCTRATGSQHIFFPFFGGPDDRLALRFVVQLCANSSVTATVVRVTKSTGPSGGNTETTPDTGRAEDSKVSVSQVDVPSTVALPDTIYAAQDTQTRLASDTADNLVWMRYANHAVVSNSQLPPQARSALVLIAFEEVSSSLPLRLAIQRAVKEGSDVANADKWLLLVSGRGRRLAAESHRAELDSMIAEHPSIDPDVVKTVGEVAAGFMAAATNASGILVLQAVSTS